MTKDTIRKRPLLSLLILVLGLAVYACLCWPAIRRRGFPEIDPFWLAMPWLWVVPIILSALFDGKSRFRKWTLAGYVLIASFFYAGTVAWIVPHHVTVSKMLFGMVFPFGPLNLLITVGVEKLSQFLFRFFRTFPDAESEMGASASSRAIAVTAASVLALSVGFPFTYREVDFLLARQRAQSNAERDWANNEAIWYVRRHDPELFGASGGETYSVQNGLMTKRMRPGVTATVYCETYRTVIEDNLNESGPTDKVKELFTQQELQDLIKSGRLKRTESFPLKHGTAEIQKNGNYENGMRACHRGEPVEYMYHAVVPEKKDALIVLTDDGILVFAATGHLLQEVDRWTYRRMELKKEERKEFQPEAGGYRR